MVVDRLLEQPASGLPRGACQPVLDTLEGFVGPSGTRMEAAYRSCSVDDPAM